MSFNEKHSRRSLGLEMFNKYLSLSVSRPRGGLGVERDGAERGGDFVERRGQPVVGHHLRDGGPRRGVER